MVSKVSNENSFPRSLYTIFALCTNISLLFNTNILYQITKHHNKVFLHPVRYFIFQPFQNTYKFNKRLDILLTIIFYILWMIVMSYRLVK